MPKFPLSNRSDEINKKTITPICFRILIILLEEIFFEVWMFGFSSNNNTTPDHLSKKVSKLSVIGLRELSVKYFIWDLEMSLISTRPSWSV